MRVMITTIVATLALALPAGADAPKSDQKAASGAAAEEDRDREQMQGQGQGQEQGQDAGDEAEGAASPVSAQPQPSAKRPIYKPPSPGKPARTVGGGSRGTSDRIPQLFALTPEHVGLTISDQPSLFWYIDRVPDAMRVEFALLDAEGVEPLVVETLQIPEQPGIQRINLSDFDAQLVPGAEYEWSVTLIVDPEKRSKDIVAAGWIDRVEPSGQLSQRLATLNSNAMAAAYAEAGLWYDTIAAISDEIERNPEDAGLVRQRADVLRQVGLLEAAGADS